MLKYLILGATIASLFLISTSCSTSQQTTNAQSRPSGQKPTNEQIMKDLDTNGDDRISKNEAKGPLLNDFSRIDSNNDGFLTKEEIEKVPKPKGGRPPRQ